MHLHHYKISIFKEKNTDESEPLFSFSIFIPVEGNEKAVDAVNKIKKHADTFLTDFSQKPLSEQFYQMMYFGTYRPGVLGEAKIKKAGYFTDPEKLSEENNDAN